MRFTLRSADEGRTWGDMQPLTFGGKTAESFGWRHFVLYSSPLRVHGGTVLMVGYRRDLAAGATYEDNSTARDQSFVVRSEDDGATWSEPFFIDTEKYDTNECMIAEPEPGLLLSFSRTLRGRHMWTSSSRDGGRTWSPIEESSVQGECPFLLTHSSGAIVITSRDISGNSVKISVDHGRTWSRPVRVPAPNMASMVELKDGRVMIAGSSGWTNPTIIYADTFRVTDDGPLADRDWAWSAP